MEETVQKCIQQLGWKQGLVFDGTSKEELTRNATERFSWVDEADSLILFSQDCDLLHHSLENEPFVEFLCAQAIGKSDVSLVHGKNPRRLHVIDTNGTWFDLQMSHRIRIPRNLINKNFPVSDRELSIASLSTLVSWLYKRYSRPAFPDTFNHYLSRIRNLDDKLKALNESYPSIKRFFFSLDPFAEIPSTGVYSLDIRVLLHGRSSEVAQKTDMKEEIEKKVEKLFAGPHITIGDVNCTFEDEVTIYELSYFRVWDKEYLSSRYGLIH